VEPAFSHLCFFFNLSGRTAICLRKFEIALLAIATRHRPDMAVRNFQFKVHPLVPLFGLPLNSETRKSRETARRNRCDRGSAKCCLGPVSFAQSSRVHSVLSGPTRG